MCGRLNLSDLDGIRKMMADIGLPLFDVDEQPRYNIAPSSKLVTLSHFSGQVSGSGSAQPATWHHMHWGMPLPTGPLVINARSESAADKPTFKHLLQQRALVPVNGFYEWRRRNGARHAWHFTADAEPALALAAIWRLASEGPQLALLTTAADEIMADCHHRMPVAITPAAAIDWLDGRGPLQPTSATPLRKRQVGSWVDNARNEGAECLAKPQKTPYTPDLFDE